LELFGKQGFVSLGAKDKYNFGTAYEHIFARDLPVLITSDSVLHVMHRSFDATLAELEGKTFLPMLNGVLASCHEELGERTLSVGGAPADATSSENYRDVDLYLTLARNLLRGTMAPDDEAYATRRDPHARDSRPAWWRRSASMTWGGRGFPDRAAAILAQRCGSRAFNTPARRARAPCRPMNRADI
jgi:hypothetical protein